MSIMTPRFEKLNHVRARQRNLVPLTRRRFFAAVFFSSIWATLLFVSPPSGIASADRKDATLAYLAGYLAIKNDQNDSLPFEEVMVLFPRARSLVPAFQILALPRDNVDMRLVRHALDAAVFAQQKDLGREEAAADGRATSLVLLFQAGALDSGDFDSLKHWGQELVDRNAERAIAGLL